MKLHESDSTVSVTHIRAHNQPIGIKNTVHQPTPTSALNSIKTKLSLGVQVNNIYRELREGIGNTNRRETSSEVISKRHLQKKSNVSDIHKHMNMVDDFIQMTVLQHIVLLKSCKKKTLI